MARRKRDRHQQRSVHEWTATGAALKAENMREELVAAMGHPLFRSARSKCMLEGNRDLRHAIDSQHDDNYEDEVAAHYAAMYDWSVASTELDAETASAMSAAFDSRLQRRMQVAEVFIVAPAMHRVVTAASATVEGPDLETLIRDDIPWENVFLVLPKRVQIGDSRGWTDLEAISWHVSTNRAYQGPALYVHSWSRLAWAQNLPGTPLKLWPAQAMVVPLDPADRIKGAEQHIPQEWFINGAPRPGWTPEASIAEAGPDNEYGWVCDGGPHAAVLGYLFAFLRIARQPMSVASQCRQPRADSVPQAWQRVRVVQLRRFHQEATVANDARQVNWRHSWIVRMHKVRQWYPSLGRHQVIFRGPYLKGPTDAPLLAGETVQALVR